jgi:hypothetical protein
LATLILRVSLRLSVRPITTNIPLYNSKEPQIDDSFANMNVEPFAAWRAFKFLFIGPLILAFLFVVNLVTSPGHWWIMWPALGIGLAWVISLFRVLKVALVVGGLAALVSYFRRRWSN